MSEKIDVSISDVSALSPAGSMDSAIGNTFFGINHRQTPSPVPNNQDRYGLTFFTRPQLNMVSENIRMDRRFIPLLTNNSASIPRIVRAYLDPRWHSDGNECAFADPMCAFIPLLSNHLKDMSGWPDITLDTFTSKPGAYKEVYSYVDSTSDLFGAFSITATFRNMVGDPITKLFETWIHYMSNVMEGIMVPYPDYMMRNWIDYNTRIYRLVMDRTNTYVQKIAACGAAFPVTVPMSKAFDFQSDVPMNLTNSEIQVQFQCLGGIYNDVLLIHQFNKTVGIFNPAMRSSNLSANMQKIPYSALGIFNGAGYPRINVSSYELEWYVFKDDYARVMEAHLSSLKALGYEVDES